jgi:para-nitrobenzyl esterase
VAELIVETTAGKVRGERHGDVAIWKGIPYAESPVGALRFQPPRPPGAWSGVRDALHFGAVAAQSRDPRIAMMSGITDKVESGEDCLFVNVFAPATGDRPAAGWPVVVWIHGGAFIMGSGSTPLYHGHTFTEQGIVVVTLNYRLGLPGLLYLGDLAPGHDAGNCLLLDQVAALRWVHDNIAGFGGDPGAVTVMGESAGAISIGTLLAMPAARGLFHRAILESGAPSLGPATRADATEVARGVVEALGGVAGLADLPIDRILAVQEQLSQAHGLGAFGPYVDGVTVPRLPIDLIREGSAAGIPLLLGSNRDEWNLFEVLFGEVSVEAFQPMLRERLGPLLDPLLEVYRDNHGDRSIKRAWVDLVGELAFRIPAIQLAEAQSSLGAPVYMYRFDWKSPAFGGRLGAGHALELPFVWNRLDLPMAPILLGPDVAKLQPLANAMHRTWAHFIRTGHPDGGGLPPWPRYTVDRRQTMIIDRDSHVTEDPGAAARCAWPTPWPEGTPKG